MAAQPQLPKPFRRIVTVLHLVLLGSLVVYVAVAFMVTAEAERSEAPVALFGALAVAALSSLGASLWVPGLVASDERIIAAMREGDPSRPLDAPGSSQRPRSQQHPLMAGASLAFSGFVLRLALTEAVAVFGLVLTLIAMNPLYCLGFSAVAFVAMAMSRFDEDRLRQLARRA